MVRPLVLVAVAAVLVALVLVLVVFRPEDWVAAVERLAIVVGVGLVVAGVAREVRRR